MEIAPQSQVPPVGVFRWVVLVAILAFYLAVPNARPDFSHFNTTDGERYLAMAQSLVRGRGYTPSMIDGAYVAHVTWPPGMPVLMMPAMAISGDRVNWLAVKWSTALVGVIGVFFVWHLARRITGQVLAADLAALAVGLNPYYWDFSHQAMADVPATVWVIGSLLLIDRVWAERRVRPWEAGVVGLVAGMAMMIKGQALGLGLVPLAYLFGPRRSPMTRTEQLKIWVLFAICFALPTLAWTVRNYSVHADGYDGIRQFQMLFLKNPCQFDSPRLTPRELVQVVVDNLRYHVIYRLPQGTIPGLWINRALNWHGSGLLALALTGVILVLSAARTKRVLPLLVVMAPLAALNIIFTAGGATRYWIIVTTALNILLAIQLAVSLVHAKRNVRTFAMGVAILVLVANIAVYVAWHERHPYNTDGPYAQFAQLSDAAAKAELHPVNVFVNDNPHAFQLITGYPTPMRLETFMFSHMVAREDGAGPQPPPGAKKVVEVYPWAVFELPEVMPYSRFVK